MHQDHDNFARASEKRRKVILTYFSGEYGLNLTKLCVPLQYSAADEQANHGCYYLWDPEGDIGRRVLVLPSSKIMYMELSDDSFEPDDYIIAHKQ